MDRMDTLLSTIAAAKRDELVAMDTETDPTIRRDRAEISPGCRLKHGDDVFVNGVVARVVCPAHTIGWFYDITIDDMLIVLGQHEAIQVEDRAPADSEEEALPIFTEPPPENP